jgi:hypothetical protein
MKVNPKLKNMFIFIYQILLFINYTNIYIALIYASNLYQTSAHLIWHVCTVQAL